MGKEKQRNESFYDSSYFELLEAMKENTCPVCFLIKKSELSFMDTLFYELVNDPGVREKLRKSYGFCPRHATLAKEVGKPLGIAIIYEDICSILREKIEKGAEISYPGKGCPVCRFSDEVEERYISIFLKNFPEKDFQNLYQQSFGLCMQHFLVICSRLAREEEKEIFKQCQLHTLQEHLFQLQEFIRKHDYRFFYEGFGGESTSWKKVVDKIVGNKDETGEKK
ncbi:hypothetical protein IBX65_00075 [Candidatus Aerophobetes bacterium]|nr:hypothetical protein [Candidatus Aerophobetes bacterium]